MPIEVELPDGSIAEFPDGTSDETIEKTLREEFAKTRETGFGPILRDRPSVGEVLFGRDVEPLELIPTGRDVSRGEAVRQIGEGLLRGAATIPDVLIPGGDPIQEELVFRGLLRPEEDVEQIPLGKAAEFGGLLAVGGPATSGLIRGGQAVTPLIQRSALLNNPITRGATATGGGIGLVALLRELGVDVTGLLGFGP